MLRWSKPDLEGISPPARSLHVAEVLNDKLYIFGGWTSLVTDESKQDDQWKVSSDVTCLNLGKVTCNLLPRLCEY